MRPPPFLLLPCLAFLLLAVSAIQAAETGGKMSIILLGDSTTEGSIPRLHAKEGPHLEDVVRLLLAAEGNLPACDVVNLGQGGDFIRRLLDSGRYDKQVAPLQNPDFIFIRYGINDEVKREDFATNFMPDYHELIARLRKSHPKAALIPTTIIPYFGEERDTKINALVRKVAEKENLKLFDLYPRYAAELKSQGQNALNYRRFPLTNIPAKYHEFVKPFLHGNPPKVEVMDSRLDAHFGNLPGWFGDRHPNWAGYHVIGDETAKFIAPQIRERVAAHPR